MESSVDSLIRDYQVLSIKDKKIVQISILRKSESLIHRYRRSRKSTQRRFKRFLLEEYYQMTIRSNITKSRMDDHQWSDQENKQSASSDEIPVGKDRLSDSLNPQYPIPTMPNLYYGPTIPKTYLQPDFYITSNPLDRELTVSRNHEWSDDGDGDCLPFPVCTREELDFDLHTIAMKIRFYKLSKSLSK